MSKDCRIVIRMSEELRDWVHEQALLGEQDDAAFVRMVLSNLRRGTGVAPMMVAPAPVAMPIVRDVLAVASAPDRMDEPPAIESAPAERATIDLDAMIGNALDEAEAQGLTERQIETSNGEPPPAGVRALFRRPVPMSPGGSQLARIEQYLASSN